MATIEEAFDVVCKTFLISALNAPQKNGITKKVEERRDVFINLPTGFGKSLLYQAFYHSCLISLQNSLVILPEKQHYKRMSEEISYASKLLT